MKTIFVAALLIANNAFAQDNLSYACSPKPKAKFIHMTDFVLYTEPQSNYGSFEFKDLEAGSDSIDIAQGNADYQVDTQVLKRDKKNNPTRLLIRFSGPSKVLTYDVVLNSQVAIEYVRDRKTGQLQRAKGDLTCDVESW